MPRTPRPLRAPAQFSSAEHDAAGAGVPQRILAGGFLAVYLAISRGDASEHGHGRVVSRQHVPRAPAAADAPELSEPASSPSCCRASSSEMPHSRARDPRVAAPRSRAIRRAVSRRRASRIRSSSGLSGAPATTATRRSLRSSDSSAASAMITNPEWPTTSSVGRSFDCTRHVKRSGSRSGIAPADPRIPDTAHARPSAAPPS